MNEILREVIADELTKIDDERLEFVTVTAVDVDAELNRGIVFYDSLAGESGDDTILEVLEEHRRRIQSSIITQYLPSGLNETAIGFLPRATRSRRLRAACSPSSPKACASRFMR